MSEMVEQFRAYRAKMNEKILAADNKVIKRIYNLDTNTYMDGALSAKVKEMFVQLPMPEYHRRSRPWYR